MSREEFVETWGNKRFYREHGDTRRKHRMGNPKKWTIELTYEVLGRIFDVPPRVIKRRIYRGLLDPSDIFDIVDKVLNPWKLDRRRKKPDCL